MRTALIVIWALCTFCVTMLCPFLYFVMKIETPTPVLFALTTAAIMIRLGEIQEKLREMDQKRSK